MSQTGGVTTIRLAVREPEERAWWRRLLEKTISLIPNCNSSSANTLIGSLAQDIARIGSMKKPP